MIERFRIVYYAGLLLVTGLTLSNYLLSREIIESEKTDAYNINLAGRQRMLSQRIALLGMRLNELPPGDERVQVRKKFTESLALLERSHLELVQDKTASSLIVGENEELKSLYFGPGINLDKSLTEYGKKARDILKQREASSTSTRGTPENTKEFYELAMNGTLEGLDHAVQLHQQQSERQTELLSRIQLSFLVLIIGLLVFSALMVFRPMLRSIKDKYRESARLEEKWNSLILNTTDIILITDENGIIQYLNRSELGSMEPQKALGKSVREFIPEESHEMVLNYISRAYHKGESAHYEIRVEMPDNEEAYFSTRVGTVTTSGKITGVSLVATDVTERIWMQAQLNQQQKLESIGTLAGGIAHEINNPINGIMNYADLLKSRLGEKSELTEYTDEIIHETKRVAEIVRNLLTFARQELEHHSPARLVDIVDSTLSLVRTIFRRDQIKLVVDVPEDLPLLKCRSQQIQQVLMNLFTNARDALNHRYPGFHEQKVIMVSAKPVILDDEEWVRLQVEDGGHGVPEDIRKRVFDPFFTTKDRAQGTGLGLSISYGIVQEHQGRMSFESKSGEFTRFTVELPVDNGWGET